MILSSFYFYVLGYEKIEQFQNLFVSFQQIVIDPCVDFEIQERDESLLYYSLIILKVAYRLITNNKL